MKRKHAIALAVLTAALVSAVVYANAPLGSGAEHMRISAVEFQSAPTLSGCSACSLETSYATNARGAITCTDGVETCTVTFDNSTFTWAHAPVCVLSSTSTNVVRFTAAITTSAFSFETASGSNTFYYHCDGFLKPN